MRTCKHLVIGQGGSINDKEKGELNSMRGRISDPRRRGGGDVSPHQSRGVFQWRRPEGHRVPGRSSESALFKGRSKSTSFLGVESSVPSLNSIYRPLSLCLVLQFIQSQVFRGLSNNRLTILP